MENNDIRDKARALIDVIGKMDDFGEIIETKEFQELDDAVKPTKEEVADYLEGNFQELNNIKMIFAAISYLRGE